MRYGGFGSGLGKSDTVDGFAGVYALQGGTRRCQPGMAGELLPEGAEASTWPRCTPDVSFSDGVQTCPTGTLGPDTAVLPCLHDNSPNLSAFSPKSCPGALPSSRIVVCVSMAAARSPGPPRDRAGLLRSLSPSQETVVLPVTRKVVYSRPVLVAADVATPTRALPLGACEPSIRRCTADSNSPRCGTNWSVASSGDVIGRVLICRHHLL